MVKLLSKAAQHCKQNIDLIATLNNSYNEIILELSHNIDDKTYRNQYL